MPELERLEIRNFLTIREASLDVGRFTVVIGPQASGKSVLAKLLYFFRSFLGRQLPQSIEKLSTKRELQAQAVLAFERIFPRYAWAEQAFEIRYRYGETEITLTRKTVRRKPSALILDYSADLADVHTKARSAYKRRVQAIQSIEDPEEGDTSFDRYELLWHVQREYLRQSPLAPLFRTPTFIPASRSFFATLQRTVFSFLANNVYIDPLMKEFGSVYESAKSAYQRRESAVRKSSRSVTARNAIRHDIEKILDGRYVYEDDQDWIVSGKRRVNLTDASSGQQESLPMLIVLAARLTVRPFDGHGPTYFVEEPEAHLFPVSQRRLVSLFSNLYSSFGYQFFLTTHSPYVLSAINNLIFASTLISEADPAANARVLKTIEGAAPIRFEDVRAYTVQEGVLKSILDAQDRVIGNSIIDSVSDEYERVLDKLIDIKLGVKP